MVGRTLLLGLAIVSLALAGCFGGDDPVAPTTSPTPTDGDGEEEAPAAPIVVTRDLYFTADGRLAEEVPEPAGVRVPGSWGDLVVASDLTFLTFVGPPFEQAGTVHGTLTGELVFHTTAPTLFPNLYDFVVWGATTTTMSSTFVGQHAAPAAAPFEVIRVPFSLELAHAAPSLVPAGGSIELRVGSGAIHEGQTLLFLVGGESPSRVNVTWTLLPEPLPSVATTTTTLTGDLDSGTFPQSVGTSSETHPIEVPGDAQWLEITSTARAAGRVDLDMRLLDGSTVVMRTSASDSDERMLLAGPVLEPYAGRTLTLEVYAFWGYNIEYEVQVAIG